MHAGRGQLQRCQTWKHNDKRELTEAMHAHCDSAVRDGSVKRGEIFTRVFVQNLLAEAQPALLASGFLGGVKKPSARRFFSKLFELYHG